MLVILVSSLAATQYDLTKLFSLKMAQFLCCLCVNLNKSEVKISMLWYTLTRLKVLLVNTMTTLFIINKKGNINNNIFPKFHMLVMQ